MHIARRDTWLPPYESYRAPFGAEHHRQADVGADDPVRPNSAKRCHSEPVTVSLAWESVSPCLPLRGRWQREALAEGEIPHGFLSPSRLRRQPPPRGGLTARHRRADGTSYPKGICSAALHGRTPSPTRGSTYRPVGRYPHRPAGINAHSAAGHMGPALQGVCVRTDRVDEPARSQISEGGLV